MKITINDHRKIHAIKEEFQEVYPYLKLEFFTRPHKEGAPSPKKLMNSDSKTLGECRIQHNKGTLTVSPEMTVGELEAGFRDVYGLSVQVFRKSGKNWLETTATDGWTLAKQNETALEMEKTPEQFND